jgi:hypothetical protein
MEPSHEWINEQLPPIKRQAMSLGNALFMCGSIPSRLQRETDPVTEIALFEDWLVHMRVLAEFFGLAGRQTDQDFSCVNFGVVSQADDELRDLWIITSQHVVHFSVKRTPQDVTSVKAFDTSPLNIRRLTDKMLGIADAFVSELQDIGHPEAVYLRGELTEVSKANYPNPHPRVREEDAQRFEYARWLYEQQAARYASHGSQAMALLGLLGIFMTLLLQAQIWTAATVGATAFLILAAVPTVFALVPLRVSALNVGKSLKFGVVVMDLDSTVNHGISSTNRSGFTHTYG